MKSYCEQNYKVEEDAKAEAEQTASGEREEHCRCALDGDAHDAVVGRELCRSSQRAHHLAFERLPCRQHVRVADPELHSINTCFASRSTKLRCVCVLTDTYVTYVQCNKHVLNTA